jgi:hypothetical protein
VARYPRTIEPQTERYRCSAYAVEFLGYRRVWSWRCRYKGFCHVGDLVFCLKHINWAARIDELHKRDV